MDSPSWPALIRALIGRQALTAEQAAWAMNEIMEGDATPAQIAGFGVALRAKGETAQEMAGRRELLLARLHEQGALTLDLNPEAVTSSVLNQYLMVKERAML